MSRHVENVAGRSGSVSDRLSGSADQRQNPLAEEAARLLSSPAGRLEQMRQPPGGKPPAPEQKGEPTEQTAKLAAANPDKMQAMNADGDQVKQMLSLNPCPELLDQVVKQDKNAALDIAARSLEMQTHALHDTPDESFRQQLRLRISGQPFPS